MYAAWSARSTASGCSTTPTLNAAIEPQVEGPDAVLMFPIPFALGFMRHSDFSPFAGPRSFGHYGAGGSVGFADPTGASPSAT
jgi:hypothetical protein